MIKIPRPPQKIYFQEFIFIKECVSVQSTTEQSFWVIIIRRGPDCTEKFIIEPICIILSTIKMDISLPHEVSHFLQGNWIIYRKRKICRNSCRFSFCTPNSILVSKEAEFDYLLKLVNYFSFLMKIKKK